MHCRAPYRKRSQWVVGFRLPGWYGGEIPPDKRLRFRVLKPGCRVPGGAADPTRVPGATYWKAWRLRDPTESENGMIILRDVPFRKMARFLYDNVCEMPRDLAPGLGSEDDRKDVTAGLEDYLALLKEIYSETESFETDDSKTSYASLLNTIKFLFGCFTVGTVRCVDDRREIVVRESDLKKAYKSGNVSGRIELLRRFGLATMTVRDQGACSTFSRATELIMRSERNPHLIPALKHFVDLTHSAYQDAKDCVYNEMGAFIKGDYEAAALQKPPSRSSLDPMRTDILKTVGCYRDNWAQLVDVMVSRAGWLCSGFLHYGHSPAWGVSFSRKGKRPTAIFTLGSETVFIEFTLPVAAAEGIIQNRSNYALPVRDAIESFKCVKCPKQCRGKNLSMVDGVALCKGRAEARRIYMVLSEPVEFSSICSMVETVSRCA